MFLEDGITIVSVNKGVVPHDQRRNQLALFEDVFFKLLKFIIGQRRNLGLELRIDFQIDHTHTPLSLLLRRFFLPEKGRNILLCGFQFEQFLFSFLVLLIEPGLFGCQLRILGFQFLRAGQLGDIICLEIGLLLPGTLSALHGAVLQRLRSNLFGISINNNQEGDSFCCRPLDYYLLFPRFGFLSDIYNLELV